MRGGRDAVHLLHKYPMQETPASRFIRVAENWIATSAAKHGVHTPAMDQRGNDSVIVAPLIIPPKRHKVGVFVLAHLGKLADLLQVTLIVEAIPAASRDLYADYQDGPTGAVRRPVAKLRETAGPLSLTMRTMMNVVVLRG